MKKVLSVAGAYFKETDLVSLIICTGFSVLSVLLQYGLYRAGKVYFSRVQTQALVSAMGLAGAVILSKIDYHFTAKLWKLHVPLAYVLVLLTFTPLGVGRGEVDDVAWLQIPGIPFSIQPAEFLKVSFIVIFALHLELVREKLHSWSHLLLVCLHGIAPVILIHFQGDDGTALIFACIFAAMLFAAGLPWKYLAAAAAAGAASIPILWNFVLDDDKKSRVLAILRPGTDLQGAEWQQYYGRLAIGSGQVWGNGIFAGDGQFQSVPEVHNDFIFSFIGEALGFMGCLAILAALAVLCIRMIRTGHRATDPLGQLICVGVFAMVASQSLINIGMNLSLFPVIGVTFPFFSSGGSSLLSVYLCMGLVFSVHMHSRKDLFID